MRADSQTQRLPNPIKMKIDYKKLLPIGVELQK